MNPSPRLRHLALTLALIGGSGLSFAQSGAPVTPSMSPTVTGTVKPGSGDQPATRLDSSKTPASPTTSGTIVPASRDQPGMTPGSGMNGKATTASPTSTQTVKPMSRSAKARQQRRMARMNAAKSEQTGSGSAGNVAGRVEGSTSSNSDGKPSKTP